jgi:polysaccharide export outer membrane protein
MKALALLALLALLACAALAQTRTPAPVGPMGDAGQANLPNQRIGPNDLLAISVYDAPEFTRTVRVGADGYFRLPMVASRMLAEGLLPAELETAIAETLVKEGILVKPVVMVTVAEYYSRPISVVGAVRKPLTFQAVGRVTLLEALARAEGLADLAGPDLLLITTRRDPASGAEQRLTTRMSIRDLIDGSKPDLNVLLHGGEEIRIPEARKIYVAGNVKKPGAFPVKEGNQMTVLRAVALAEGMTPFPQKHAYIYRQDDSKGGRVEIEVEFAKILKRQAVDIPLEPEDTLYIPEASGRKAFFTTADRVVATALATVSGVLIWRGR